jgi:hypothetical protein
MEVSVFMLVSISIPDDIMAQVNDIQTQRMKESLTGKRDEVIFTDVEVNKIKEYLDQFPDPLSREVAKRGVLMDVTRWAYVPLDKKGYKGGATRTSVLVDIIRAGLERWKVPSNVYTKEQVIALDWLQPIERKTIMDAEKAKQGSPKKPPYKLLAD